MNNNGKLTTRRLTLRNRLEGKKMEMLIHLCSGNFGVVFKAVWRGAACVVKQLKFDGNELAMADFTKEVQTMM